MGFLVEGLRSALVFFLINFFVFSFLVSYPFVIILVSFDKLIVASIPLVVCRSILRVRG